MSFLSLVVPGRKSLAGFGKGAFFLILSALRESGGTAVAVPDAEMMEAARTIGRTQGIFGCPEGAATLAALRRLRAAGWVADGETVVLYNTGSGLKYAHLWDAG